MSYCRYCGEIVERTDRYCPECGRRIKTEAEIRRDKISYYDYRGPSVTVTEPLRLKPVENAGRPVYAPQPAKPAGTRGQYQQAQYQQSQSRQSQSRQERDPKTAVTVFVLGLVALICSALSSAVALVTAFEFATFTRYPLPVLPWLIISMIFLGMCVPSLVIACVARSRSAVNGRITNSKARVGRVLSTIAIPFSIYGTVCGSFFLFIFFVEFLLG